MSKKLTRDQWEQLNAQLAITPDLSDSYSYTSGEHYILVSLLNKYGYRPRTREQAMELAQELLCNGYQ